MTEEEIAQLSTEELVESLKEAGYSKKAKLLKKRIIDISRELEKSLRETNSKELNRIIHDIGTSSHYVLFKFRGEELRIHSIDTQTALFEKIHQSEHTFHYLPLQVDFSNRLGEFYGLDIQVDEDPAKINLDMNPETYDKILAINENELDRMIDNEPFQISLFLKAFKANDQKIDQITYSNGKTDKMEDAFLFIPAEEYIWSINYRNVNNNQIIATSSPFKKFFEVVQLSVVDYLTSKVDKKVEKKDEKFFSFKRGFIFYWKSNVFLLFSILLFLLNKNSWAKDGDSYVWVFGIQLEALLMILSFIACLRPRV
ncbi:hypothetical protein [Rossellomorea sp. NRS-1567]|uniref:hypothetical protein n=1 Tax=Rossellomorea sp. NRS-1567 TaxID=3233901 RepID=UPI003D2E874E